MTCMGGNEELRTRYTGRGTWRVLWGIALAVALLRPAYGEISPIVTLQDGVYGRVATVVMTEGGNDFIRGQATPNWSLSLGQADWDRDGTNDDVLLSAYHKVNPEPGEHPRGPYLEVYVMNALGGPTPSTVVVEEEHLAANGGPGHHSDTMTVEFTPIVTGGVEITVTLSHPKPIIVLDVPAPLPQAALAAAVAAGVQPIPVDNLGDLEAELMEHDEWEAVVIHAPDGTMSQSLVDGLIAYVADGGRLLLNYANLEMHPDLQAALGVATAGDVTSPLGYNSWLGHPVWSSPHPLLDVPPFFLSVPQPDLGDRLSTAGGTALGGFTPLDAPGEAAVVEDNDGRTLVVSHSFLHSDLFAAQQFTENALNSILQASGPNCSPVADLDLYVDCFSGSVHLEWTNTAIYTEIEIRRDGVLIATLDAPDSSYVDTPVAPGHRTYSVTARCAAGPAPRAIASVLVPVSVPSHIAWAPDVPSGDVDSVSEFMAVMSGLQLPCLRVADREEIPCHGPDTTIWLFAGTYPNIALLTEEDGEFLRDHVLAGGNLYIEGADLWAFTPPQALTDIDGVDDLTVLDGDDSFFGMTGLDHGPLRLDGMDASYNQDTIGNDYTDRIAPSTTDLLGGDAAAIWLDDGSGGGSIYTTGVFYDTDPPYGKVLCQTWEFGGYGGDTTELLTRYLEAFDGYCERSELTIADGVEAWSRFGVAVSISGNHTLVGAVFDDEAAQDAGAVYAYRYDGVEWIEEQQLVPSVAQAGDAFGRSIAVRGDVAIVGAHQFTGGTSPSPGYAVIYRHDGTDWVEEQILTASDGAANDRFGVDVDIDGAVAVVGAHRNSPGGQTAAGAAYVYRFNGVSWVEEQKLTGSQSGAHSLFGYSVSVLGDVALVGARWDDTPAGVDAGAAYLYDFDGITWTETQRLVASDGAAADEFGIACRLVGFGHIGGYMAGALMGAAVGAVGADDANPGVPNCNSGAAYIFHDYGTGWTEEQKLVPHDTKAGDRFGQSVDLADATSANGTPLCVIGASGDDVTATNSGSAYVYTGDAGSWTAGPKLVNPQPDPDAELGFAVSVDGDRAIVGAFRSHTLAPGGGSAHLYSGIGGGCESSAPPTFRYSGSVAGGSSSVSATGGFEFLASIEQIGLAPGAPPAQVQGFSMALAHDPLVLSATDVSAGAFLAGVHGGSGPEFFASEILADGFTVGVVLGLQNPATLEFPAAEAVIEVDYEIDPSVTAGDTTQLEWSNTLGLVENVVVLDVQAYPPCLYGIQEIEFSDEPEFKRGDANADGTIDVADPVFTLALLFSGGDPPSCDDAADTNDDGVVNIADAVAGLSFLFGGGSAPQPPFPLCGVDPEGPDSLGCVSYLTCF